MIVEIVIGTLTAVGCCLPLTSKIVNNARQSPRIKFKKLTALLESNNSPNCINCYNVITEDLAEIKRRRNQPSNLCESCEAKQRPPPPKSWLYSGPPKRPPDTPPVVPMGNYGERLTVEEKDALDRYYKRRGSQFEGIEYFAPYIPLKIENPGNELVEKLNQKFPYAQVMLGTSESQTIRSYYSRDYTVEMQWINSVGEKYKGKLNVYLNPTDNIDIRAAELTDIYNRACIMIEQSNPKSSQPNHALVSLMREQQKIIYDKQRNVAKSP